jgi:Flp pilus assembly protein TadD
MEQKRQANRREFESKLFNARTIIEQDRQDMANDKQHENNRARLSVRFAEKNKQVKQLTSHEQPS